MADPKFYEYKLFLEGVAIPFSSASITASVNAQASCSIEIPPVEAARNILPRTMVALFFYEDGKSHLIFEGEVVGKSFVKGAGARAVRFTCVGYEMYWQQAYRTFYDTERNVPTEQTEQMSNLLTISSVSRQQGMPVTSFLSSAFMREGQVDPPTLSKMGSISWGFNNLFLKTYALNNFHRLADKRIDLLRRVRIFDNQFSQEIMTHFLNIPENSTSSSYGPATTLYDIIMDLLKRVYYIYLPITSPAITRSGSSSKLIQSVMMPDMTWSAPPRCNVLFPEDYAEFSFGHNMLAEPTRTEVQSSFGWHDTTSTRYYEPAELSALFKLKREKSETGTNDAAFLLPDEFLKGVIYNYTTFNSRDTIHGPQASATQLTLAHHYEAIVHWIHSTARLVTRTINNLTGPFNPYLVCGLPGVLLDTDWGGFMGNIVGYTHSIHPQRGASTVVQMSHIRLPNSQIKPDYFGEGVSDYMWQQEDQTPVGLFNSDGAMDEKEITTWYDARYDPQNVGEQVYADLLGTDKYFSSIMEKGIVEPEKEGEDPQIEPYESISVAVSSLIDEYVSRANDPGERMRWMKSYRTRDIATEHQVMVEMLGATPKMTDEERERYDELTPAERDRLTFDLYEGGISADATLLVPMSKILDRVENGTDNTGPGGPFLLERQEWAKALRKQLEDNNHIHFR